jgi:F-type H+-transporting ATPase subunit gamma
MLIAITSERGLCGGFNRGLVGSAIELVKTINAAGQDVDLVCLGTQGKRLFAARNRELAYSAPSPSFAAPSYPDVEALVLQLLDLMDQRGCGRLLVIHNAPVHRFQHQVTNAQLFPFEWPATQPRSRVAVKPDEDTGALVTHLITERVLIGLYKAIILSATSEELARVAAMKLATDNARKRLDELTSAANQARQLAETNALLEIISGFEAASRRILGSVQPPG